MQYTIEARQLTSESTHRPGAASDQQQLTIEAPDADDAISQFVQTTDAELVSVQPVHGRETIATVKKADSVFLVRVYAN